MKNRKKQDNAAAQSAIYVGFVDTPGLFASIIRRVIGQNYVHVVLGFDPELKEAYSIGRRNPAIPLFAGFERENREKILKKYPTARYQVCRVACTNVQREALQQEAKTEWERRFTHHYMVIGLLFLLAGIAFDQKNHDTCSSWLARVTQKVGLQEWQKPFPLVTRGMCMNSWEKTAVWERLYSRGHWQSWWRAAQRSWLRRRAAR